MSLNLNNKQIIRLNLKLKIDKLGVYKTVSGGINLNNLIKLKVIKLSEIIID